MSISAAVTAIASSQSRQRPIIMITSPAGGHPRVCLPDWGELHVIDDHHLRVAVWPTDPTAADLDGNAPTMLIVTTPSGVHVIDATARRLANAAMVWTHYELTITSARVIDRGTTPPPQTTGAEVITHDPKSTLTNAMSMSSLSKIWREGRSSLH